MGIETFNKFMVGSMGDNLVVQIPQASYTPDEALLLAAYLVSMAEHSASNKFDDVLNAVQGA